MYSNQDKNQLIKSITQLNRLTVDIPSFEMKVNNSHGTITADTPTDLLLAVDLLHIWIITGKFVNTAICQGNNN